MSGLSLKLKPMNELDQFKKENDKQLIYLIIAIGFGLIGLITVATIAVTLLYNIFKI